jgi:formate dehydrogenase maturation protein FdhE
MTPQEKEHIENAIRHIQTATDVDPWAAGIAVECMKKQIPQKPVIGYAFPDELREVMKRTDPEKAETKTACCPVCGRTLRVSKFVQTLTGLRFGDPYCKSCGQAICWEETKNDER